MTKAVVSGDDFPKDYCGGFPQALFSHNYLPVCDGFLTKFEKPSFLVLGGADLQVPTLTLI